MIENFELLMIHCLQENQLEKEFGTEQQYFYKNLINLNFWELFNDIISTEKNQLVFNFLLKVMIGISSKMNQKYDQCIKILDQISSLALNQEFQQEYFMVFYTIKALFMKQNWLGKDFLFQDADKQYRIQSKLKLGTPKRPESEYNYSILSDDFKNLQQLFDILDINHINEVNKFSLRLVKSKEFILMLTKSIRDSLMINGEQWPKQFQLPQLFIIAKSMIHNLETKFSFKNITFSLWYARITYMHDVLLRAKTNQNQLLCFTQYNQFFNNLSKISVKIDKNVISGFQTEYGNVMIYYYKYKASLKAYTLAKDLLGLKVELTGKLGKRTKYQTFEVAQLVLDIQKGEKIEQFENNQDKEDLETEGDQVPSAYDVLQFSNQDNNQAPKNYLLDDQCMECILHEFPVISDDSGKQAQSEFLNPYEQVAVLGLVQHMLKSSPNDETLQVQVQAYVEQLIKKSENWLVFSNTLYVRSLNEIAKLKRMERALLQIEQLVQQFNDKKPNLNERYKHFYSINYPDRMDMQERLAQIYMKCGSVMSSCQLFERQIITVRDITKQSNTSKRVFYKINEIERQLYQKINPKKFQINHKKG